MPNLTARIEHNGTTYAAETVRIDSTTLGREDHGIFTAAVGVDFGNGGHTGLGNYSLDDSPPDPGGKRRGTANGLDWIISFIETVGAGNWENLVGCRCYALYDETVGPYSRAGFNCKGIASADGKRVMLFEEIFAEVAS